MSNNMIIPHDVVLFYFPCYVSSMMGNCTRHSPKKINNIETYKLNLAADHHHLIGDSTISYPTHLSLGRHQGHPAWCQRCGRLPSLPLPSALATAVAAPLTAEGVLGLWKTESTVGSAGAVRGGGGGDLLQWHHDRQRR
jgi:hypothetical protein